MPVSRNVQNVLTATTAANQSGAGEWPSEGAVTKKGGSLVFSRPRNHPFVRSCDFNMSEWQPVRLKPEQMWCEIARYNHTPEKDARMSRAMAMTLYVRPTGSNLTDRNCGCPLYEVHPSNVESLSGCPEYGETVVSLCQIWTD